jgi:integrase
MQAMTEEEANRFLAAAASDPHHVLFALLITTGLRPNEALGLKWSDRDVGGSASVAP